MTLEHYFLFSDVTVIFRMSFIASMLNHKSINGLWYNRMFFLLLFFLLYRQKRASEDTTSGSPPKKSPAGPKRDARQIYNPPSGKYSSNLGNFNYGERFRLGTSNMRD